VLVAVTCRSTVRKSPTKVLAVESLKRFHLLVRVIAFLAVQTAEPVTS
jgi:hypothetical protein